jgi:hypothetical protein
MKKLTDRTRVKNYMARHPDAKPAEIAQALKVTRTLVYSARQDTKKERETWAWAAPIVEEGKSAPVVSTHDPAVNHPEHYKVGGIETIDFIEAKQLNYHLGNVVKYITRAEHKGNQLQDLQKALWYLEREIKNVQA